MFCIWCGAQVADDCRFCPHCGGDLQPDSMTEPPAQQPDPGQAPVFEAPPIEQPVFTPPPAPEVPPVQQPVWTPPPQQPPVWNPQPRKRSKAPLIVLLIVILCAAAAALILLIPKLLATADKSPSASTSPSVSNAGVLPSSGSNSPALPSSSPAADPTQAPSPSPVPSPSPSPDPSPEAPAYIIPDSDSRYLTRADLIGLTDDELRLARNEIYARRGRMFSDTALQDYFNQQPWYQGTIAPEDFTQAMLNDFETQNANLILEYENERKGVNG